jgi:alpha-N-acetylglucosaminidase
MFGGYYLPRWREFFRRLNKAMAEGKELDRSPFAAESCEWERGWSNAHGRYPVEPRGDAIAVARKMWGRWKGPAE